MPDGNARGRVLAAITTRLVQLHAQYYGRGPTKARTYIFKDLVVCLLRDGLTPVERELVRTGDDTLVETSRRVFQRTMGPAFRRVVEEETGREVTAYMTSMDGEPGILAEIFVLAGSDEDDDLQAGSSEDGQLPAGSSDDDPRASQS